MHKKILAILFFFSCNCFANTVILLPDHLTLSSNNPSQYFPIDVQTYFSITADPKSSGCDINQDYILSLLIYRNAVDNKVTATYRPSNDTDICWIDLLSYSDQLIPDMSAGGWQAPANPGENTWCVQLPSFCPILDNSHSFYKK
jgi:hypothetical protein